jgi:hypothetical protein
VARYDLKRLNEDLKRELEAAPAPKKRVRGHRATQVHGEAGLPKAAKNRQARRKWRQSRDEA